MNKQRLIAAALCAMALLAGCSSGGKQTAPPPSDQTTTPPSDQTTTPPSNQTTTPPPTQTTPPPATSGQQVVEIQVKLLDYKFEPKDITVPLGAKVKLVVTNDGQRNHDLAVVGTYGQETDILEHGKSQTLEFVADKAGEFEIVCTQRGHKDRGMVGKLIVK